jgi:stalled ribosome rescue protein Dom34
MLEDNPLRAWYGEGHVFKAADRGAIGKLLVSDELFRCVLLSLTPVLVDENAS